MKQILMDRVAHLAKAIAEIAQAVTQMNADLNTMRGQKMEAESMLVHMVNKENAEKVQATAPVQDEPQAH